MAKIWTFLFFTSLLGLQSVHATTCYNPSLNYNSKPYAHCSPLRETKFPATYATCKCKNCNISVNLTCEKETFRNFWKINKDHHDCGYCRNFNKRCTNPMNYSDLYKKCWPTKKETQFPTQYATCECKTCPLQVKLECTAPKSNGEPSWKIKEQQHSCGQCSRRSNQCNNPETNIKEYKNCKPVRDINFPAAHTTCECKHCRQQNNLTCFTNTNKFTKYAWNYHWDLHTQEEPCDECYICPTPISNNSSFTCENKEVGYVNETRECTCKYNNCMKIKIQCHEDKIWKYIDNEFNATVVMNDLIQLNISESNNIYCALDNYEHAKDNIRQCNNGTCFQDNNSSLLIDKTLYIILSSFLGLSLAIAVIITLWYKNKSSWFCFKKSSLYVENEIPPPCPPRDIEMAQRNLNIEPQSNVAGPSSQDPVYLDVLPPYTYDYVVIKEFKKKLNTRKPIEAVPGPSNTNVLALPPKNERIANQDTKYSQIENKEENLYEEIKKNIPPLPPGKK